MSWQTIRPWLWRGVWTLIAAVAVLLLSQLHLSIVRTALTQAGARDDVPLILEITDACGRNVPVPLFWHESSAVLVTCPGPAKVRTTAPHEREFALFVNNRLAAARTEAAAVAGFNIALRPGSNQIAVFGRGTYLAQPFASRTTEAAMFRPFHYPASSARLLRSIPLLPVATLAYVSARPAEAPPPRLLGRWNSYDVYEDMPDADGVLHEGQVTYTTDAAPDGLALFRRDDAPALSSPRASPSPEVSLLEISLSREITVERRDDGSVVVTGSACLPHDHALIAWARAGALDVPEFIARIAAVTAVGWTTLDPARWPTPARVTLAEAASMDGCDRLEGSYTVANAMIQVNYHRSFLQLPGDRLTVRGFGDALRVSGRPPDRVDGTSWIWTSGDGGVPFIVSGPVLPAAVRATVPPPATSEAERRTGLFSAWRSLPDLLPNLARAVMLGLAAAAPVALIYWAMTIHQAESLLPGRIIRARAGLLALLAFMLALAAHPLLLELSRSLAGYTGLWAVLVDEGRMRVDTSLNAPIALAVLVMIVPVLGASDTEEPPRPRRFARMLAALVTFLLLALAVLVAYLQRILIVAPDVLKLPEVADALPFDGNSEFALQITLTLVVLGWLVVGFFAFWIPMYWLFRSALPRGRLAGASFSAAMLVFFLPLIATAAECARLALQFDTPDNVGLYRTESLVSQALAVVGPSLVVVVIVILVLRGFREIAACMMSGERAARFRAYGRPLVLIGLALFIVGPSMGAFARDPDLADFSIFRFMTTFQAYGVVLALLAPLAALRAIDDVTRTQARPLRFQLGGTALLLITAAFAGYLTLWQREPLSVLVLMAIGWATFHYAMLGPQPTADAPANDLAKRILAYNAALHSIEARRKTFEKKFSDGKISSQVLETERNALTQLSQDAGNALGLSLEDAKQRLFQLGPGDSPFANALIGAAAGLIVAGLLQLLLPFDLSLNVSGKAANWLDLARAVIADPAYRLVDSTEVSQLLAFVNEAINAVAIWVIAGFLFGIAFHRIHGSDGFIKALVFSAGLAVPFLLGQDLTAAGYGAHNVQSLTRALPLFLFLAVLGAVVFDGKTLMRQGVGIGKLPEIYGLTTSVGYVSFAGALASAAPLLQLIDWLTKGLQHAAP